VVAEAFERTLRSFAKRVPFRGFTVELVSGGHIEVDHPEALVFRAGVAVFIDREGYPSVFDRKSVSQLISGKPHSNGKSHRPRKR
jgi:hypothetical protein